MKEGEESKASDDINKILKAKPVRHDTSIYEKGFKSRMIIKPLINNELGFEQMSARAGKEKVKKKMHSD
jgi:hypothetical protein